MHGQQNKKILALWGRSQIQTSAQRLVLIKLFEAFLCPCRQIPGYVNTSLLVALRVAMDPGGTRQQLELRSC
jgi:hypothetical protein